MTNLNWGMISNGGVFESLVHAVLFSGDKDIILFGRPGKDSGQDARTKDGKTIYQAKYCSNMKMANAISDAKNELQKIIRYRNSDHPNFSHWSSVKKWVLVGNFEINPNDLKRWNEEVVTEFEKVHLQADFWCKQNLENKLFELPHIRGAFFEGYNRILLGLTEAYNFLVQSDICIDCSSDKTISAFDATFIDREKELKAVIDFAGGEEKRILPVVGLLGSGKSRLLYESLFRLRDQGWRVFWAMPESMNNSDQWFSYLNSNQKTCIAIDEPPDAKFLQRVLEQLAAAERNNWKVIVSCDVAKYRVVFRNIAQDTRVAVKIDLQKLSDADSRSLVSSLLLENGVQDETSYKIARMAGDLPGWLCFVTKLVLTSHRFDLIKPLDERIADYLDQIFKTIEINDTNVAEHLLRWVAIYNPMVLNESQFEELLFGMLETKIGVSRSNIRDQLKKLTETQLVYNRGVNKCCYAIRPNLIRECILSKWLLDSTNGRYTLNDHGKELIRDLVQQKIPQPKKVLLSLSQLTWSRINENDGYIFLDPIFVYLKKSAQSATEEEKLKNILELVKVAGIADSEQALDVLSVVRENYMAAPVPDQWLKQYQSMVRSTRISELSDVLFYLSGFVEDANLARRYLIEYQILMELEKDDEHSQLNESNVRNHLRRIFGERGYRIAFGEVGRVMLVDAINSPADKNWDFLDIMAYGLLSPTIEEVELTSHFSINISRITLSQENPEWEAAEEIRTQLFERLKDAIEVSVCDMFWKWLSRSHLDMIRAAKRVQGYKLVKNDLKHCLEILNAKQSAMSMEEAVYARKLWAWHLDYEPDDELLGLAKQCETVYNGFSKWPWHDLFKFPIEEGKQASVVEQIKNDLILSNSVDSYLEFFNGVKNYLDIIRQGRSDLADDITLRKLADALYNDHNKNTLMQFVKNVLKGDLVNSYAVTFSVCIIQMHIKTVKARDSEGISNRQLNDIFSLGNDANKVEILSKIYGAPHPNLVGQLTKVELDYILEQRLKAREDEPYILLGAFAWVNWQLIQEKLDLFLSELNGDDQALNDYFWKFICSAYLSVLRYSSSFYQKSLEWIINVIKEYNLNGEFLNSSELNYLREQANFKLSMVAMLYFMQARLAMEQQLSDWQKQNYNFEVLPHDFKICDWCQFDESSEGDREAFQEFCELALRQDSLLSLKRLPEYIADLDSDANEVSRFVNQKLSSRDCDQPLLAVLSSLAEQYPNTSDAWASVARPICNKVGSFTRKEREYIYSCLSRGKPIGFSVNIGQVPNHYYQALDDANHMYSEERDPSLVEYRRWAVTKAERCLEWGISLAEEENDG